MNEAHMLHRAVIIFDRSPNALKTDVDMMLPLLQAAA